MRIEVSLSGKRKLPGMSPSTTASFCRSSTASMRSLQADADAAGADDGAGCRPLIWSSAQRLELIAQRLKVLGRLRLRRQGQAAQAGGQQGEQERVGFHGYSGQRLVVEIFRTYDFRPCDFRPCDR